MPPSTARKGIASILVPLVAGLSFWLPPAARAVDRAWGGGEGVWTDTSAKGWNGTPPTKGDRAIIRSGSVAATANNQQEGVAITLPAPADKRTYASASLLGGGNPVTMTTNPDRSLTLTLPPGHAWNPLDTVVVLTPADGQMERKR